MNGIPRSSDTSTTLATSLSVKPKLTTWAQAAAKSAPKHLNRQTKSSNLQPPSSTTPLNGSLSNVPVVQTNTQNRKSNKLPYNRTEVLNFMDDLYKSYTKDSSVTLYSDLEDSTNSLANWGTYSSSKSRSKKYGCLAEIAAAIKKQDGTNV
ncbi:similar to Saccharomyces cerevisiae YDL053C PBP4 Pbp1p binding protein, interacts strongly with Pab1p-binding protein 1 (Pbp1p) in the yeast two-hybrid system [Maudiozyma saulgeensis]|uniref:Similar to Saccharomyces cerevisiae YDL053C PBP4 Pbp1p binding protein, interacts strongly with Pab1p-binding protein 1 (Pbp1p) in the yeast two-hybrid system n=1 Tax=Maudiozyma saulgeensis TaxID=1789683 RepID=A0A1X7QZQ0_9SACH|nr:similar to Saccharomyces cerevisiae YDL053C PBP4 Pbp1p binding protein, interacts strongly with Pab1p-binding protein 1 (Pbp1p) in the yeast two-hybrid system [Kazachstania saulgeensis]